MTGVNCVVKLNKWVCSSYHRASRPGPMVYLAWFDLVFYSQTFFEQLKDTGCIICPATWLTSSKIKGLSVLGAIRKLPIGRFDGRILVGGLFFQIQGI